MAVIFSKCQKGDGFVVPDHMIITRVTQGLTSASALLHHTRRLDSVYVKCAFVCVCVCLQSQI